MKKMIVMFVLAFSTNALKSAASDEVIRIERASVVSSVRRPRIIENFLIDLLERHVPKAQIVGGKPAPFTSQETRTFIGRSATREALKADFFSAGQIKKILQDESLDIGSVSYTGLNKKLVLSVYDAWCDDIFKLLRGWFNGYLLPYEQRAFESQNYSKELRDKIVFIMEHKAYDRTMDENSQNVNAIVEALKNNQELTIDQVALTNKIVGIVLDPRLHADFFALARLLQKEETLEWLKESDFDELQGRLQTGREDIRQLLYSEAITKIAIAAAQKKIEAEKSHRCVIS